MTRAAPATPRTGAPTWRRLLVWLHVVGSVSWMSQTAALGVLLFTAASTPGRAGAAEAADLLDSTVLLHSTNVAAATGFLLSATTSWGFFHHRWVTAKFVATVAALYLGVFVLTARMDGAVAAVRAGDGRGATVLAVVAVVMASGLALQAWLSVAKPGGRSRRSTRPTPAPPSLVALAVLAPLADVALGIATGNPVPMLSLTVLAVAGFVRRRATVRSRRSPRTGASQSTATLSATLATRR